MEEEMKLLLIHGVRHVTNTSARHNNKNGGASMATGINLNTGEIY
jgi:hypothetical protein